jgi:ABC-2 type transport system permease protein
MTTTEQLVPARMAGWRSGLGILLRKELHQWWGTRLWWLQLGTWVVILNGITVGVLMDAGTPAARLEEAVQTFFLVGAFAIGVGAVLTAQGAVVAEKELGTAAWVMSKPASRPAFVLAKLGALAAGFLVTAILVPSVVFVAEVGLGLPVPLDLAGFTLGAAVVAVAVLYYLALTLALGTMFSGRGPVAGIGMGFLLFGMFGKGMLPPVVVLATPWTLGDVASATALGDALTFEPLIPIAFTLTWTVVLVGLAIRRFGREEF